GRSANAVIEQLRAMYEAAAQSGVRVVAGSIVPFNTATPDQNARMREVNSWIHRHARADANVSFVDTRRAAPRADNPDVLAGSPEELPPSPEGYRRMGEAILPALEHILEYPT